MDRSKGARMAHQTVEDRHVEEPYCYLTTTGRRTGLPREIEIWFAPIGDTIYLMNGEGDRPAGESDWVRNLRAAPSVAVRIADWRYRGVARLVVFDSDEHERARELLVAKYDPAGTELQRWRDTAFPVAIELTALPAHD
jgi:deazaflavin-dependent oxidoreductase (nitroreductase family)